MHIFLTKELKKRKIRDIKSTAVNIFAAYMIEDIDERCQKIEEISRLALTSSAIVFKSKKQFEIELLKLEIFFLELNITLSSAKNLTLK